MRKTKTRIEIIDIAKAITIFLVIMGHTTGNFDNPMFRRVLYSFHMPLFFMLAGLSIKPKVLKNKEEIIAFIRKNILALFVPYLIWGLIYGPFSFENILKLLYGSWASIASTGTLTSLWYLPCLFVARMYTQIAFNLFENKDNKKIYYSIVTILFFIIGFIIPYTEAEYLWCFNVSFVGLNIINSPSWNLHPFYSEKLSFIDLTLRSIPTSPNTDGFDPESCKDISLLGTRIYVGDDCVAIKSGKKIMADRYFKPCENITIRNCFMGDGHGGVVFGSESSCGIKNVEVSRCIFRNTDRGLRIKTKRGRGNKALIENVSFDNILMDGVMACLVINMYYYLSHEPYDEYADSKEYKEVSELTPHVGAFSFRNMECLNTKACVGYFYGLPESPIDQITLDNIKVTYDKNFKEEVAPAMIYDCERVNHGSFYFYNVREVIANNVVIESEYYHFV